MEVEAVCERGIVTSLNNGETWQLREPRGIERMDEAGASRDKIEMSFEYSFCCISHHN